MFEALQNQVNFPKQEEKISDFWQKEDIFKQQIAIRKDAPHYTFYDGPPFATGLPHYGHLLASTIKDIVPRYFAMKGYQVPRRFGWDCHGLPVEMEIQKKLDLKDQKDVEDYGVANFNKACRDIVFSYASEWEKTITRLGRWVDFDNDYKTLDTPFMESVWWVFKELYKKGLIYRGFKVMPYSWKAGTILSNFEANQNYQDTTDPAITVKFSFNTNSDKKEFFLAWTTTPWTLIANLGLAIGPKLTYLKLHEVEKNEFYYLGEKAARKLLEAAPEKYKEVEKLTGTDLIGKKYTPLFPYSTQYIQRQSLPTAEIDAQIERCFTLLDGGDVVKEDEGVGIIHMAPVYGEDDYAIGEKNQLPHYDPVDESGNFVKAVDFIAGQNIKDADSIIIKDLKERGLLFKRESYLHSYPFCWRTDTPLMYKSISTWFVNVEAFRANLNKNNQEINWLPKHIKDGRFGKWLENARDWAISRNRYWGTPIPIWECDGEFICIGDIEDLKHQTGEENIDDLHKEYVDKLIIKKDGKEYRRVSEVLDCWFESGSMPFAQNHYPFENQAYVDKNFPADFISEGLDQTRGWFYTLLVISTGLFNKPAFKNCIVSGLILAEDGKKMSKRLKNYPDPHFVFDQYGADALRVYLSSSNVIKGEALRFSEAGLKEVMKSIMIPLWNSFTFLTNYANLDGWDHVKFYDHHISTKNTSEKISQKIAMLSNSNDRWIISYLETLVDKVNSAMQGYELYSAVPPIIDFINRLTNTYIRRSRKRFWRSETDQDKDEAYFTLYYTIKKFSIALAPFMPFLSERIYQVLRLPHEPISVHLEDYPNYMSAHVDKDLEKEMEVIESILSLGRSLRLKHHLKIRQPLSKMVVISNDPAVKTIWETNRTTIEEELNLKETSYSPNENEYVSYQAKVDFKKLGKVLGGKIKAVNTEVMQLASKKIATALQTGTLSLPLKDEATPLSIDVNDLDIRRSEKPGSVILNQGIITLSLETALTPALISEGLMREFINRIQKQRKEIELDYNDRIAIYFEGTPAIKAAVEAYQEIIARETLANKITSLNESENHTDDTLINDNLNGEEFKFFLKAQ